jgi:hypothetical protein
MIDHGPNVPRKRIWVTLVPQHIRRVTDPPGQASSSDTNYEGESGQEKSSPNFLTVQAVSDQHGLW